MYVERKINGFPSRMTIITGANMTIVRTDVAKSLDGHLLYTVPSVVSLQTVTGDHIAVHGKLRMSFTFEFTTFKHLIYVADIADPCILGLDFPRKYNFFLDLKNNELHTSSEGVEAFEIGNEELLIRHIVAAHDLMNPAGTKCFVTGRTDTREDFRFDLMNYSVDRNFPKDIFVAASLMDLSEGIVSSLLRM